MKKTILAVLMILAALCVNVAAQEDNAEDWFQKGEKLKLNGSHEEALNAYDKAIELNQSNALIWNAKSIVLFLTGEYEKTIEACDKALELEMDEFNSGMSWQLKGEALRILGRTDEAKEAFENALAQADKAIEDQKNSSNLELSIAWLLKGELLERQDRYEEAFQAYGNATAIYPNYSSSWVDKGDSLRTMGRYDEAIEAYDRALEIDPKEVTALSGKGDLLRSLGKYDAADELYDKIMTINPNITRAWYGKGEVLRSKGKYDEAIEAYDKAIELNLRTTQYGHLIGKGMALDGLGKHEKAIESYNQAILIYDEVLVARSPRSAFLSNLLGDALKGLGRLNEAINAYETAIEINPRSAEAWYNKGQILWYMMNDSEADAAFAKAEELGYQISHIDSPISVTNVTSIGDDELIEIANNDKDAHNFHRLLLIIDENNSVVLPDFVLKPNEKIKIHFDEGECNETDMYLNYEVELNDVEGYFGLRDLISRTEKFVGYWTSACDWLNMGEKLSSNGSYEEALDAYDKAIEMDPQLAKAWIGKGNALDVMGKYDEAIEAYDSALNLSTENDEDAIMALTGKAVAFSLMGEYNESFDIYDHAIELTPANQREILSHIWNLKGGSFMSAGRFEEALNAFDKATQTDPENSDAWFSKGKSLSEQGKYEDAIEAYEKSIDTALSTTDTAYAWYNKGEALKNQGLNAEADEAFNKAKELGY